VVETRSTARSHPCTHSMLATTAPQLQHCCDKERARRRRRRDEMCFGPTAHSTLAIRSPELQCGYHGECAHDSDVEMCRCDRELQPKQLCVLLVHDTLECMLAWYTDTSCSS